MEKAKIIMYTKKESSSSEYEKLIISRHALIKVKLNLLQKPIEGG